MSNQNALEKTLLEASANPLYKKSRGILGNQMMTQEIMKAGYSRADINEECRRLTRRGLAIFKLSGQHAEDTYYPNPGLTEAGATRLEYLRQ